MVCTCFPYHQTSSSSKSRFSFSYELRSDHQPNCLYYKSSKVSRSYGLAVRLLPFLHKTIELAFSTTTGAGGASNAANLRVYRTMRRQDSPVLQMFDQIYHSCADIVYRSGAEYRRYLNLV